VKIETAAKVDLPTNFVVIAIFKCGEVLGCEKLWNVDRFGRATFTHQQIHNWMPAKSQIPLR